LIKTKVKEKRDFLQFYHRNPLENAEGGFALPQGILLSQGTRT
jgi:hypothetical protein